MGSEALSKVARRDIRRAFAPEASEEVLKFVDGIRHEIATDKAAQRNATKALNERIDYHVRELEHLALKTGVCFCATFGQRLRWLATGRWQ